MSPERLVYMANQIATFFASQGEGAAVAGTLDHLKKFWDPRMRAAIIDLFNKGGDGLDSTAREAVRQLSEAQTG